MERFILLALWLLVDRSSSFQVPIQPPSRRLRTRCCALPEVDAMRAGEIKSELESYGISTKSFLEKTELVEALKKARADGLEPKKAAPTGSKSSSPTASAASSSSSSTKTREERLQEEIERCRTMKASELRAELKSRGVNTAALLEKAEFVQALAEARVDCFGDGSRSADSEGYAEYANVEVLTDDSAGPRKKQPQGQQRQSSPFGGGGSPFGGGGNPFGGGSSPFGGGASPFGGGMGDMGGIADMLKNMGMGGAGAGAGASPFGGAGGANPFGGVGGNPMGKAQELMQNPKVREIMQKAQSNPRIMSKVNECMSNPASFAKYQNDPEVAELIRELKKYM